jgi:predicted metal-binding membrane protein
VTALTPPATRRTRDSSGLSPAVAAMRATPGFSVALFGLAGLGWWWTTDRMRGMDNGPWTALGAAGWFLAVWVVMMAAMMLPSVAPTVALYTRMTKQRSPLLPFLFVLGYLLTWAIAGLLAFAAGKTGGWLSRGDLQWNHTGRVLAGVTLLVAAAYQLSPLKNVCLGKCRSPLGLLLGSWRDGRAGAVKMGTRNGAWCVGCCWALMASLFALGVMSVVWMAFVAGLIAIEKTLPWRRPAAYGTALLLSALGVLVLAAPDLIPALTIPHSHMQPMGPMGP